MLDTDVLVESEAGAMPTLGHGLIASRLQRALGDYVEERGLGLLLGPDVVPRGDGAERPRPGLRV